MSDSSTKLTTMDDKTNHEKEEEDTTTATSSSSSPDAAKRKTEEGASLSSTDSGNKKLRVADTSTIDDTKAGEDLLLLPPLNLKKIPRVDLERFALSVLQGGGGEKGPPVSILQKSYENCQLQENSQKEWEELFYQNKDIWIHILSFIGPGNFIYIAGVSQKFKQFYLEYFNTHFLNPLKEKAEISIPKVYEIKDDERFPYDDRFLDNIQEKEDNPYNDVCFLVKDYDARIERPAKPTDTFYSVAFATKATTIFWDNATLKDHLRLPNDRVCRKMAKYQCFESLKWAYKQRRFKWGHLTTAWAAANGRLDMLKFANENGCPMNKITSFWGASSGNLDVLKYIRNNNKNGYKGRTRWDERTSAEAAKVGNLDMLKWIREQDPPCPWDERTSSEAAKVGNLEMLIYCHQNDCPWDSLVCSEAANLDILQYAHRNGCPWDKYTTEAFANRGAVDMLEYAHANGCPLDEDICRDAASRAELDVLKWYHSKGLPWDEETAVDAVEGGHLPILKWLHDNGCPLNEEVCIVAAEAGNLEILKYAQQNGCPWKWKEICARAHCDVIDWLLNNGCPEKFRDEMVEELARENGCQFPSGY